VRYIYATLLALVTVLVFVFIGQNMQSVTVSFLNIRLTMPLFLLKALVYFLGMVSGGSLVGLVRALYRRATQSPRPTKPAP